MPDSTEPLVAAIQTIEALQAKARDVLPGVLQAVLTYHVEQLAHDEQCAGNVTKLRPADDGTGHWRLLLAIGNLTADLNLVFAMDCRPTPLWWVETAAPFADRLPFVATMLRWVECGLVDSAANGRTFTADESDRVARFRAILAAAEVR